MKIASSQYYFTLCCNSDRMGYQLSVHNRIKGHTTKNMNSIPSGSYISLQNKMGKNVRNSLLAIKKRYSWKSFTSLYVHPNSFLISNFTLF